MRGISPMLSLNGQRGLSISLRSSFDVALLRTVSTRQHTSDNQRYLPMLLMVSEAPPHQTPQVPFDEECPSLMSMLGKERVRAPGPFSPSQHAAPNEDR